MHISHDRSWSGGRRTYSGRCPNACSLSFKSVSGRSRHRVHADLQAIDYEDLRGDAAALMRIRRALVKVRRLVYLTTFGVASDCDLSA